MDKPTCSIDDCDNSRHARGLCKPHYRRDHYRRNREHERATNRAYVESKGGAEWANARAKAYNDRVNSDARRTRAEALKRRLTDSHRTCTQCSTRKLKADFYRDSRRRDGLFSWCIECFNAHLRDTYDADAASARRHEWYENRGGREHSREKQRTWYRNNPEKAREQTRRYQARRMGATVGEVDYGEILAIYGMVCHICGGDIESKCDLHFDHVWPLSKGGAHSMDNIKPSHALCNIRKGARLIA